MLLWFAGMTFLVVVLVFDSPKLDYRIVMLGALVPLIEVAIGGPWILHTLLAPVVVLGAVMVLGRSRLAKRRWIGLPIGMFMYLVLDAAWANEQLFLWPLFGVQVDDAHLPTSPPLGLAVALEVAGFAALAWGWHRFGLSDPRRRELFWRTGNLDRDVMPGRSQPDC